MAKRVVLVRHAESEANAAGTWQGASSTPLTAEGRTQAVALGNRLRRRSFHLVEGSDLERSVETARIAGFRPRVCRSWREGDIGEWEGRPGEWVEANFGDEVSRLAEDYDRPMGITGESPRQVAERGWGALSEIVGRLDEHETGLVFAHGGLIELILWRMLGIPTGRRRLGFLSNASLTEVRFDGSYRTLAVYNDAAHLGPVSSWSEYIRADGGTVVDLIRHGVTQANLERRVQGRMDSGLHPAGRSQAKRLRRWIGPVDEVFASSLQRASTTAELAFGLEPVLVDDLMEINFGEWEGALWAELAASGRLSGYLGQRSDVRRGVTGETWSETQSRVNRFLSSIPDSHQGKRVAAVSHGGAIKAATLQILGFGYEKAHFLGPLANTSVTQVSFSSAGHSTLTTYNLTPHLED